MYKKKIIFLTGTRADYGKLKPLIFSTLKSKRFETSIIATGMHLQKLYGYTYIEIKKDFGKIKIYKMFNQKKIDPMHVVLSKTIKTLDKTLKSIKPDLVVIHGDRVETLAASIYCNLNNILIAHIEGGEVSGTVDESLRHSTTKLSHIHFTSNVKAKNVLRRMGEIKKNIYVIGSPEVDIMLKKNLPTLNEMQNRYNIKFNKYLILLFHPVTTLKKKDVEHQCRQLFEAIKKSLKNFIIIYPNNDTFSEIIFKYINKFRYKSNFKILPSMKFEYFQTLLKHSECIIGNSSAGIREAPVYGVKTINLGNRQKNRTDNKSIVNLDFKKNLILKELKKIRKIKNKKVFDFGLGNSGKKFIKILNTNKFWKTDRQKYFSKI